MPLTPDPDLILVPELVLSEGSLKVLKFHFTLSIETSF
jgi:hypothetical protein